MKRTLALCALVAAVMLFASQDARATTVFDLSPAEQIRSARAICRGTCTRIESRKIDGQIYTYITFDVREVLKGGLPLGRVVIKQFGGKVGDDVQWIDGSPRFDAGREYVVFLDSNGAGAAVVSGMFLGAYDVRVDARGEARAERSSGGCALVLARPGAPEVASLETVTLAELRTLVWRVDAEDRSAGKFVEPIVAIPAEYDRPFEDESEIHPTYAFLENGRWFEPDTGERVRFFSNPTNFDSSVDLGQAEADALLSWSSVPGASLRMEYAGVDTTGCGWRRDGVSRVSVDCRNEVTGVGCRSVVAIGGACAYMRESVTINGHTFNRIVEADVCLNDGYCDLFADPVTLRYVLAHELGHCIGLNHSTDETSTMFSRYRVANGERGAGLAEDDMNGVRAIYPGAEEPEEPGEPVPAPVLASQALGEGIVGEVYAHRLAVEGGVAPFVWGVAAGALPAGLSMNVTTGEISGTPTARGASAFRALVRDARGLEAQVDLVISVRAPTPVVESARYLKAKGRLEVRGVNFAPTAVVTVNGVQVAPGRPTAYDEPARTLTIRGGRKKLNIQKGADANVLVVTVDGSASAEYRFTF